MMKRLGGILCLAVMIISMTASVCFGAETLKLEKSYPKDGMKNTTIENMGIKLWFNNDMGTDKDAKANKDCFQIVDDEGKKLPLKVLYNPKDDKEVLVLVDATNKIKIKDNTEYKLKIDGSLEDKEGNTLGKDEVITFKTLNQRKNQSVYMVMMGIMFVGMFLFSSHQAKKKQKEAQEINREEPFNPYKEAKKTGKSVEEVVAQHEKEVARREAKEARRAARNKDDDYDDDDDEDNGNYKVKRPRPISEGGGKYKTGRKAEAEARKAQKAADKKKKRK